MHYILKTFLLQLQISTPYHHYNTSTVTIIYVIMFSRKADNLSILLRKQEILRINCQISSTLLLALFEFTRA